MIRKIWKSVELLTQPQIFQTETLPTLLQYLPYLFSAYMSQKFFFCFRVLKNLPQIHSYELYPCNSGWTKRDRIIEFHAIVHASAASAVLDLDSEGAEKQHEEYGKTLGQAKFLTSDTPSALSANNFEFFSPRTESFILEHWKYFPCTTRRICICLWMYTLTRS